MPTTTKGDVNAALLEIQEAGIEGVTKDARNPHFKNTYITLGKLLDAVLPALSSKSLVLTQIPEWIPAGPETIPALRTTITHTPSGTSVYGVMPLMLERSNPQGLGSAITYARRYALMSILSLTADEDDDGQAASPIRPSQTKTPGIKTNEAGPLF